MNTGAFGEGFPYSNFHDLNMDWIIKIAKDFLDQYTHIQEIIEQGKTDIINLTDSGLEQLEEKATVLENALQAWYNEHSEDIANQLTSALNDLNEWYTLHQDYLDQTLQDNITAFNNSADLKAQQTIESIPSDYSTFFADAYKNRYVAPSNFDLNSVEDNCVYQINGAQSPQHYPTELGTKSGILITNKFTSSGSVITQLLIGYSVPYVFIRYKSSDAWSDWISMNQYQFGSLTSANDLNNITIHSTYVVLTNSVPAHYPPELGTKAGYILTVPFYNASYIMQQCVSFVDGLTYYRIKRSNVWDSWKSFPGNALAIPTSILSASTDLNDLQTNTVYSVSAGSYPTNYPFTGAGIVITIPFSASTKLQFVLPFSVNSSTLTNLPNQAIWSRSFSSNTWSAWVMSKQPKREANKKYYAYGDSVAYGYSSDHSNQQSPYNYPAQVSNLTGVRTYNKCVPGQGLLKDWDTIIADINNTDFTDVKLITVNWAYNDSNYYDSVDFGNPTDPIPSSTSGITTWIGHYAKIMSLLQSKAPNAQVILITGYGQPSGSDPDHLLDTQFTYIRTFRDGQKTVKVMYDALEEMANHYGFNCINQSKGTVINRFNCTTIIGDNIHPTYDGYKLYGDFVASKIKALFNNLIN